MNRPLNIAHRGASAYAPENTFAAYDLALSLGAEAIELDVQETADGELVVVHDETTTRTLRHGDGSEVRVDQLTWEELARFDAGTWFNDMRPAYARPEYAGARVPRLRDIFERYGRSLTYFIELKHPPCQVGMEEKLVELVRTHALDRPGESKVIVGAFSQPCLQKISSLDPRIPTVQLFHSYATGAAIRAYLGALPSYCSGIGPCKDSVEELLMRAARRHSLDVYTWTVNDRYEMTEMMELGVHGLVTDFPDVLDDVISTANSPTSVVR